jgi:hypothetical protein
MNQPHASSPATGRARAMSACANRATQEVPGPAADEREARRANAHAPEQREPGIHDGGGADADEGDVSEVLQGVHGLPFD